MKLVLKTLTFTKLRIYTYSQHRCREMYTGPENPRWHRAVKPSYNQLLFPLSIEACFHPSS